MIDFVADNVRIMRTFRLQDQEQDLFAELGNEAQLRNIRSKAANLNNVKEIDPELTTYIPSVCKYNTPD